MSKPTPARTSWLGWLTKRLLIGVSIVLILVTAAPWVIAHTPLRHWVVAKIGSTLGLDLHVQTLSLNWFGPVELGQVFVRDHEGNAVAEIQRVSTSRTLLGLAVYHRSDLGTIRFEKPAMKVVFANNTSNLEVLLAKLPKSDPNPTPGSSSSSPSIALEWEGGSLHLRDQDHNQNWLLDPIQGKIALDPHGPQPIVGSLQISAPQPKTAGTLQAEFTGPAVSAQLKAFPIDWLAPILRRYDIDLEGVLGSKLQGECSAKLENTRLAIDKFTLGCDLGQADVQGSYDWSQTVWDNLRQPGQKASLNLDLAALAQRLPRTLRLHENVRLTAGALAFRGESAARDGDVVWTASLKSSAIKGQRGMQNIALDDPITLDVQARNLHAGMPTVDRIKCASRFLKIDGSAKPGAMQIAGSLELDELSKQLSQFLDLGPAQLAGTATFGVKWNTPSEAYEFDGSAQLDKFRMTWGPAGWDEPKLSVKAVAKGRKLASGQEPLDQAYFEVAAGADVASVQLREPIADYAKSPAGAFYVKLQGDLNRWHRRARLFVPALKDVAIAGSVDCQGWLKSSPGKWDCERCDLKAKNFVWNGLGLAIDEPTLDAVVVGSYEAGPQTLVLKESQIRCDALVVHTPALLVRLAKMDVVGKLVYQANLARVGRWYQDPKAVTHTYAGTLLGQATFEPAGTGLAFSTTNQASNLVCKVPGLNLSESKFDLQTAGVLNQSVLDLKNTLLRCSACEVTAPSLKVDLAAKTVAGQIQYQADVNRLRQWTQDPKAPGEPWAGLAKGQMTLRTDANRVAFDLATTIEGFVYGPKTAPKYQDAKVSLAVAGDLDWAKDRLGLEKFALQSQLLACSGKLTCVRLASAMDLAVDGTLTYDWQKIEPILQGYLGKSARIAGKDTRRFRISGPLYPNAGQPGAELALTKLEGEAGLNWQSAQAMGAVVGPAEIKARLAGGMLVTEPILATLNQGKLRLEPKVRLDTYELTLSPGVMIEQARITPEMCASGLGYALPTLANIAEAEGKLSLEIESARIPLLDPYKSTIHGFLTMHNAQVGPGSIVKELTSLLKMSPRSIIRENRVKVKMENGRIHHENLQMEFQDNFVVKTSGSVGLDGTLALEADMPFPAKLLGSSPISAGLPKNLKVPIRGTLDRPSIDPKVFSVGAGSVLQGAGEQLLNKGLDQLLKPRK